MLSEKRQTHAKPTDPIQKQSKATNLRARDIIARFDLPLHLYLIILVQLDGQSPLLCPSHSPLSNSVTLLYLAHPSHLPPHLTNLTSIMLSSILAWKPAPGPVYKLITGTWSTLGLPKPALANVTWIPGQSPMSTYKEVVAAIGTYLLIIFGGRELMR